MVSKFVHAIPARDSGPTQSSTRHTNCRVNIWHAHYQKVPVPQNCVLFFLNLRNVCPGFSLSKNFSTFSSSYASDAKCLPQITLFLKFTSLMFPNSILHATSQRLALSNCVCPCGKRWLVMPRLMLTSHPQTWHFGMILQIAASNLARCTQTRQDNSAQSGNGNAKC